MAWADMRSSYPCDGVRFPCTLCPVVAQPKKARLHVRPGFGGSAQPVIAVDTERSQDTPRERAGAGTDMAVRSLVAGHPSARAEPLAPTVSAGRDVNAYVTCAKWRR
jgi:hypothetical protein